MEFECYVAAVVISNHSTCWIL